MTTTDQDALREELARLVRGHDWSYERGSYAAYIAGSAVASRIRELVKALPDGVEVHNAHAPSYYHLRATR